MRKKGIFVIGFIRLRIVFFYCIQFGILYVFVNILLIFISTLIINYNFKILEYIVNSLTFLYFYYK